MLGKGLGTIKTIEEGSISSKAIQSVQENNQPLVRRWLVWFTVIISPAALVLALPPFNYWPLAFVALVPFFLLIRISTFSTRRLFWIGTGMGALYWAGLYHMFFANVPYPWLQIAPWLIWVAAILIFLLLSFLAGLTWGVYPVFARRVLARRLPWPYLWLAAGWVGLEIVRTLLFWNVSWGMTIGYSLPPAGVFGQIAGLGSVFLVSFGLVAANWFLTDLVTVLVSQGSPFTFRSFTPSLTKLALLLVVWAGSGFILENRLAGLTAKSPVVSGVAVQTSQVSKNDWLDDFRYDQLLFQAQAVQGEDSSQDRLIVLPEVSYGIDPSNRQQMTSRPSQLIYPDLGTFQSASAQKIAPKTTLVAGFVDTTDQAAWHNGAEVVNRENGSTLVYKRRLFPFGEHLPFKNLWPEAIRGFYRYATLPSQGLAKTPAGPISVLFCNEVFMPSLAARDVATGAGVITILSSNFDVGTPWYAVWQQRAAAYRAVETWRSVVLATDQASAAVIEPSGKILSEVSFGSSGLAQAAIPVVAVKSPWVSLQLVWKVLATLAGGILVLVVSRRGVKI